MRPSWGRLLLVHVHLGHDLDLRGQRLREHWTGSRRVSCKTPSTRSAAEVVPRRLQMNVGGPRLDGKLHDLVGETDGLGLAVARYRPGFLSQLFGKKCEFHV